MNTARAPLVYVVVLSWNGRDDTLGCLATLAPLQDARTRVLVVDNGSTDGTSEAVAASFPQVEILRNPENFGFPGGNNPGIRLALDRGADYVVLLNNDTTVDAGFVSGLLEAAARFPEAGFYSSKILFFDRPDVLWFAGCTFDRFTGRSVHTGFGESDSGQYDTVREIPRPCGCAMMASRRLLEEVGLMEEKLFLYGDEIDWMLRARAKGFSCVFAPGSRVRHKVSPTTGGARSGNYLYYCVRNTLHILNTHAPCRGAAATLARNVLVVAMYAASVFTMGLDKANAFRGIREGVRDYRRGVLGPR